MLDRLEGYYDAVPRNAARAEDFGALTLFVRAGAGWPYYARPTLGATTVDAAAVDRVRARQRELGVPENFEWVAETTPALRAAVERSGLVVHEHPLMALDAGAGAEVEVDPPSNAEPGMRVLADGTIVRVLDADDPILPSALAVPHIAFAAPGTAIGPQGPTELAEATRALVADGSVANTTARIRAGLTVVAAAIDKAGVVLCAGQHQPLAELGVSEVVGVGTLPAARRRGLGLAVTAALVGDARARGVSTVFLAAGDDDVARIYARLGFSALATALIAEPEEPTG
nr:GNAT family N-acetyltransferase [Streptomyces sp. SID3343]